MDSPWPYVSGYDNCPEVPDPVPLTVKGTIPEWLEGALYRGGRVTFRSRNTSNDLRERYRTAEAVTPVTFCQRDPCKTIFQKFFTTFKGAAALGGSPLTGTNGNVVVIATANFPGLTDNPNETKKYNDGSKTNPKLRNLITTTDGNVLQQLDPVTLEPIRLFTYGDLDDSLKTGNLAPAHPCVDLETGEYFTVLLSFGPTALYKVVRVRQSSKGPNREPDLDVLAEIKSPRPTYLHSFAMTKRFVVVAHWQCDFAAWGLSVLWYGNAWESFKAHDPNVKASFYLIDRHAGRHVATFETDAYFSFHIVNAFDDGDDVVVDIPVYKDHTVIGDYFIDNLRNETGGKPPQMATLRRYRLSDITKHVSKTLASDSAPIPAPAKVDFELDPNINFELPSINPNRHLHNYRYTYGVNRSGENNTLLYDRIIKIDIDKVKSGDQKSAVKFWIQNQCTPSEPVFIPTPGATEEDDGVLLSIVLDGGRRTGFMLILNAQTMEEIARADMPEGKIAPHNFHGMFIPHSAV
ncbi:hypothetical protein BGZ65_001099 [Modicella reniformis]|uniref:Carotenoid oxygenase n=1 Tax=Modicella reniformis TaxID=1440133 RepID=A0A9P6LSG7_9FUNG|nr:hypothetical protein BGZ65_001099 [Modicella reniformis]